MKVEKGKLEGFKIFDSETGKVVYDESMPAYTFTIDTRKALMQANLELTEELAQARAERDAALAETARVTALFESCIPPTAEEWDDNWWNSRDWRTGWDSCRQKLIDMLRRPR